MRHIHYLKTSFGNFIPPVTFSIQAEITFEKPNHRKSDISITQKNRLIHYKYTTTYDTKGWQNRYTTERKIETADMTRNEMKNSNRSKKRNRKRKRSCKFLLDLRTFSFYGLPATHKLFEPFSPFLPTASGFNSIIAHLSDYINFFFNIKVDLKILNTQKTF